jgi:hypothetical protein
MKIITYATHSQGTFDDIMNSGHDVEVLGWGTKWNGFMDKFTAVLEFLDTQPDDELVIFIDGFDSTINKNVDDIEEVFDSHGYKVIVSHDKKTMFFNYLPDWYSTYERKKIFGTCIDDYTANTGLYMGRAKELKEILVATIQEDSDDDQRNFNSVCQKFPYIKVDVDNIFFENCSSTDEVKRSKAYFSQMPGTLSISRIFRAFKEYGKYHTLEISIILLVLCITFYKIYN